MWRWPTAPRRWRSGSDRRATTSSSTGRWTTRSRSIRRCASPTTCPGSRTATSASAATTKRNGRTRTRTTCTTCAGSTMDRSAAGHSCVRGSSSSGRTRAASRPPKRPRIRVNDAFTSGGAQVSGGQHARTLNLGADLDYVRGLHSLRAGFALDGGWYRSDSSSNYLGTYTFDSLQAFLAQQPSNYTRRLGDPNIAYRNLQGGLYLQDDIRLQKESDAESRPALRSADTCPRVRQSRTARRHDVGAVRQRPDGSPRERGHLLRLARHRHLRGVAPRGWRPPAGTEHPQSVVPGSRQRRFRAAGQPLPAGSRLQCATNHPGQRWCRSGAHQGDSRRRHLQLSARVEAVSRPQPQRAGGRHPASRWNSATSSRSSPTPRRASTNCRSMPT